MKIESVKYSAVKNSVWRFDPSFHLSEAVYVHQLLEKSPCKMSKVDCCSDRVFLGNIFSRNFVKDKEYGVPYLAASDTVLSDINTGAFLSKRQANELSYLMLEKDWILVTCSGTVGNVTYTNKCFENHIATHDLIRIVPNDKIVKRGCVYAYLSSKFGHCLLTQSEFGGVVKHVNDEYVRNVPIPQFPAKFQEKVDNLIKESARLREEANDIQKAAMQILYSKTGLNEVSIDEYNYFGPSVEKRAVSSFVINKKLVTPVTINAFNLSLRNRNLIKRIKRTIETKPLIDCLDENGLFSTGSFPRIELNPGHGVMLINQKDIFDTIIKGKYISKRNVRLDRLVEQNEIMIAGVGTLAETESFCRCIYANEYLKGKLVSGEFIRMKTNQSVMSGYLYLWLSSDYGFRLIRSTQAGTKLCRPIPKLLEQIPVPIIKRDLMKKINDMVLDSQNKLYQSVMKEIDAISLVEKEIDGWNA